MSSELPSTQPALGHLGMKTVVLSGQQVPWQAAHLQSREVRVKQLQPRLPPCPNHSPGGDHDSWFQVQREDGFSAGAEAEPEPTLLLCSA